jgi:transcriptional regulator with XRE-family HTH domain
VIVERPIFAQRLKSARKKKNYSQIQVFEHTGINNKTLSGYEKGKSQPDFDSLTKLCTLYEVSTDWLLGKDIPNKTMVEEFTEAMDALTDEEFADRHSLSIDGKKLTIEEARATIAFIRTLRNSNR